MDYLVNNYLKYISTNVLKFLIRVYIYTHYVYIYAENNIEKILLNNTNNNNSKETAILTEKANEQHYEIPTHFFKYHLGSKLKYSSCENSDDCNSIDTLEIHTLNNYQKYLKLYELKEGNILETGCGWGSLSIYNAIKYPNLKFVCFSNSKTQIEYINSIIKKNDIKNLKAIVEDYNIFCGNNSKIKGSFDRVVSIETIEHCRNIETIFKAIHNRLKDDGFYFIQSLVKQNTSYIMTNDSWMGRHFFSGGQILSIQNYLHYNKHLIVEDMIPRNGSEYSKTLNLWLSNLEKNKDIIIQKYGSVHYEKFRLFYIMSSEAFRSINGNNYMTCYYFLKKR